MKAITTIIFLLLIILIISSCAAGPNNLAKPRKINSEYAGFWKGLWHGIISPVTFIISLFNKNINIYEVRNNGGWYNFGFILGIMIIFGGSSNRACKIRKKEKL